MEITEWHNQPGRRFKLFKLDLDVFLKSIIRTGTFIEIVDGVPEDAAVTGYYIQGHIVQVRVEHHSYPHILWDRAPDAQTIKATVYYGPELQAFKKFIQVDQKIRS